jgi:hypothetical protein
MAMRVSGLVVLALTLVSVSADAEEWSRARIARLPDSAFAIVEVAPNGKKVRHLPHHNETGAIDRAHLRAARARLPRVRWRDPASEAIARRHLEEHVREGAGPPARGTIQLR